MYGCKSRAELVRVWEPAVYTVMISSMCIFSISVSALFPSKVNAFFIHLRYDFQLIAFSCVSPDSWSSGSSREVTAAPVELELPNWNGKARAREPDSGSPGGSEVVSSSLSVASEVANTIKVEGDDGLPAVSTVTPSPEPVAAPQPRKAKARTAFSEEQMSALNDRFNMQRYLTPAEMKTLAAFTGLTYKQVHFFPPLGYSFYSLASYSFHKNGTLTLNLPFSFKGEDLVSKSQNEVKEAPER